MSAFGLSTLSNEKHNNALVFDCNVYQRISDKISALIKEEQIHGSYKMDNVELQTVLTEISTASTLAFEGQNHMALNDLHKALYTLYNLFVELPTPGSGISQFNPDLITIRRKIESSWMAHEISRIEHHDVASINTEEFLLLIKKVWRSHSSYGHPIFEFMQKDASLDQIKMYFGNDYALNMRFYDLIVMSMIGVDERVRGEVSGNFWDEMGRGSSDRTHVQLFRNVLKEADLDSIEDQLPNRLGWEGLAGYNLMMFLAIDRSQYFHSLGALAITELSDPEQYQKLVDGCTRVGLGREDRSVLDYYIEHISVDSVHGDGWLDNVIAPLVDTFPEAKKKILVGCCMRMNTTKDYWDWLLAQMKTEY